MYKTIIFWFLPILLSVIIGCEPAESEEDTDSIEQSTNTNQNPGSEDTAKLLDNDLVIAGTLELDTSYDESSAKLLKNNKVELQDLGGNLLATGLADSQGQFEISASTLLLDSSTASLTSTSTEKNFQIQSVIKDDGEGKVLGVKQAIHLSKDLIKNRMIDTGEFMLKEMSAIKGKVSFVNPDGTENQKIALIGTTVYLPGYSLVAKTDKDGNFLILYVPPAEYTLRIEKGNISYEQAITVEENKTKILDIIKIQTDTDPPITTASKDSTDFKSPFCVTLAVGEAGSAIYYTTDGSNPQASETFAYPPASLTSCGEEANCPICIQNYSTTLKYFSQDQAGNKESLKSKFYFYNEKWADVNDNTAPTTTALANDTSLASSSEFTSNSPVELRFELNEGGETYYTLSTTGTPADPTGTAGKLYSHPLKLSQTTQIKYFSKDWSNNVEVVKEITISIFNWNKGAPVPIIIDKDNVHKVLYSHALSTPVLVAKERGSNLTYVFSYDPSNDSWTELNNCDGTAAGCPLLSRYTTASYGSGAYNIIYNSTDNHIFAYDRNADDSYIFNETSKTWTKSDNTGNPTNASFLMYYDKQYNKVVQLVFDTTNKAYTFNYGTNAWSQITVNNASAGPDETQAFLTTTTKEKNSATSFLVWGETLATSTPLLSYTKVFTFSLSSGTEGSWSNTEINSYPTGFYMGTLSYDPERDLSLFFGGGLTYKETGAEQQAFAQGENWLLDGSGIFSKVDYQTSPSPRRHASMTYIPITSQHILVGGDSDIIRTTSETWLFGKSF